MGRSEVIVGITESNMEEGKPVSSTGKICRSKARKAQPVVKLPKTGWLIVLAAGLWLLNERGSAFRFGSHSEAEEHCIEHGLESVEIVKASEVS